jgi:TonB family protein
MITLFDLVVDVSAVLLIALFAVFCLRRRSAALRHWVLSVALFCAALAPLAELVLPAWTLPFAVPIADRVITPAADNAITSAVSQKGPAAVSTAAIAAGGPAPTRPLDRWLLRGWLAGALALLTVPLIGLARLVLLTARARPIVHGVWAQQAAALLHAYDIRQPVRLRESVHPRLLLVWGWRRPTLIIPRAARRWRQDRVLSVLRHELAHVKRHDWLTQIASEIVRALYWFNPLVWLVCGRLHVEREQACDDAVIAAGVAGASYAEHLLDVARDLRQGSRWAPAPAIVRPSTLERRVRAMLDRTTDRRPLSRRGRTVSLAMLLVLFLAIVTIAAAQQFSSITGTIVDPSHGLLPGVTLILTNDETKAKYEIKSDRNGRYQFVGLPSGTYSLESKLPGFAVFRGSVTVSGKAVEQNMMLSIGELQESISIVGSDRPPSPEELRAREERKFADRGKVEAMMAKRAAQRCPAGASTTTGSAIGGNIRVPVKLVDVRPVYPERMRGNSGDVVLKAVIGLDGKADRIDVESATDPAFANSAIDAVKQWQFDATLLNCAAVETPMRISLTYRWQ